MSTYAALFDLLETTTLTDVREWLSTQDKRSSYVPEHCTACLFAQYFSEKLGKKVHIDTDFIDEIPMPDWLKYYVVEFDQTFANKMSVGADEALAWLRC